MGWEWIGRLIAVLRSIAERLLSAVLRLARKLEPRLPNIAQLARLEARFPQLALLANRGLRVGESNMFGWLLVFAIAAGFAIAFGILFGVFDKIITDLNNTGVAVDQAFLSSIDTASGFAGTGILIALAVGVIGLAMLLIRVIGGMGGG